MRAVTRDPNSEKAQALTRLRAEVVQATFDGMRRVVSIQNPWISGIEAEIEQRQSTGDSHLEDELASVQKAISALDGQERRLLRLYGKASIDEKKLDDEIARIKTEKEAWEDQHIKLEALLRRSGRYRRIVSV